MRTLETRTSSVVSVYDNVFSLAPRTAFSGMINRFAWACEAILCTMVDGTQLSMMVQIDDTDQPALEGRCIMTLRGDDGVIASADIPAVPEPDMHRLMQAKLREWSLNPAISNAHAAHDIRAFIWHLIIDTDHTINFSHRRF